MRIAPRMAAGLAVAALTLASVAGCAGGSAGGGDASRSPAEVLAAAKAHLDDTSGVRLSLSTQDKPSGDSVLTSAEGVITDAPAFEGTASGSYKGIPASDIPVVSVDGVFQVKLPFAGYTKLDPASLCAPDPALLLDPGTGVSSVLVAATDLKAGSAQRGGTDNKETLTPYSGTVPGSAVTNVLPCSKADSYDVTFTVNSDDYLRTAALTGDFFTAGEPITYTIDVEDYDVTQDITAP